MKRPCPEFEPLLIDRADGSIDPAAAARLETHLAGCEACRAEAAAFVATFAAGRLPPTSEAEQRALDRAQVATLRHWRGGEGQRRNRSLLQGFSAGFAVAAAAAVLVIAPGAYRRAQQAHGEAAVPGNAAVEPNVKGAAVSASVPGNVADIASRSGGDDADAAGWEPDLEDAWDAAVLALGDEPTDGDTTWASAADLYDLDDE